jgi:hypothetical protein
VKAEKPQKLAKKKKIRMGGSKGISNMHRSTSQDIAANRRGSTSTSQDSGCYAWSLIAWFAYFDNLYALIYKILKVVYKAVG